MDDEYDEFGNYIGGALPAEDQDESESEEESEEEAEEEREEPQRREGPIIINNRQMQVGEYLGSSMPANVEVMYEDEDRQALEKPIIEPKRVRDFDAPKPKRRILPKDADAETAFISSLMHDPRSVRNVAIVGHLHHGKTTFCDYLLKRSANFTDTRKDEQRRALSIKCTPVSAVLQNSKQKSFLVNFVDVPGHINFLDEAGAAMRLCDGVTIVVDAVEGLLVGTEKIVRLAVQEGLPITLVVNKVDRLILELKLPPEDAYVKLRHTIEEVNTVLANCSNHHVKPQKLSPELGNVVFASGEHRWSLSVPSMAQYYGNHFPVEVERFAGLLWGDVYYDTETRKFSGKKGSEGKSRSFVHFILEPLYKIYAYAVGEDPKSLAEFFGELKVYLRREQLSWDVQPFLIEILSQFFGGPNAWVESVTKFVPDPREGAERKTELLYTGSSSDPIVKALRACSSGEGDEDSDVPLVVHVTKLFHKPDASGFLAWGRVFSGLLKAGDRVKILGEAYTVEDEEDMVIKTVGTLYQPYGRERTVISEVPAGNWVLIDGIDEPILKTATLVGERVEGVSILRPLNHITQSTVKVSVEPLHPQELPKMVDGLRNLSKTYPLCMTKVEESGEHVLMGTGELYLDCLMHDLRQMYAEIEVKISDPVTTFAETVVETSALQCYSSSPNNRNKLTMIAEPFDLRAALGVESDRVWGFGPIPNGSNALLDDTLRDVVDKTLLYSVKESVVQGFQWGVREGPLCDEEIRNVKFRLLNATISTDPTARSSGQIIPTARRVLYSAFLMATPRLMEPVYSVEITTPVDAVSAIYTVLARRRGHVTQDEPKPGTPLYVVKAYVPVMDSFGLETDIRAHTQGQAFCLSVFDHWSIVPGDPLDKSIVLKPLEPSPPTALARDFMVKTRKRKGASEDVSINKYFDDPMLLELTQAQAI